jgi:hypothetical protein
MTLGLVGVFGRCAPSYPLLARWKATRPTVFSPSSSLVGVAGFEPTTSSWLDRGFRWLRHGASRCRIVRLTRRNTQTGIATRCDRKPYLPDLIRSTYDPCVGRVGKPPEPRPPPQTTALALPPGTHPPRTHDRTDKSGEQGTRTPNPLERSGGDEGAARKRWPRGRRLARHPPEQDFRHRRRHERRSGQASTPGPTSPDLDP